MKQETISALGTQSRRSASGHNSLCNAWKRCPLSVGRLLLITLLLFAFTGGAKAEEKTLTVYEGTVTSYHVPANIYYFDDFSRSQVVIPASDLTEMKNGAITALTFYTTNDYDYVPYETKSEADVYLKEVNYTTMSAFEPKAGATVVYQGTLNIVSDNGGGKLTIEFATPFIYQGGHLLIGIENTTKLEWKGIDYYGQSVNDASAFYGKNETSLDDIEGDPEKFIPKTTFTYDPSGTACLRPSLTVGGITHSQATLTCGGGSGTYNVQYKKASDTNWTVVASSSTNTTFTLTGLSPLTAYEAQVQSVCEASATSGWRTITFTTTAEAEAVGDSWSDDFEGNTCGWELVNGDLTNEWTWGTATQLGGSKALYISNDGGAANAYNNTGAKVFATKLLTFTEGKHEIAFDWKAKGESTYDFLRAALVPATQTLTAGTDDGGIGTTSLPEGWIAVDGGNKLNLADEWQRQSTVVNVSAGNYYLVFAWRNDGSTNNNPPAAVDNVSITRITCESEVTGLAVSDLTTNSATLTWTPIGDATQWEVAYSTNAAFVGATTLTVSAVPYTITGLSHSTHYYAKVRAYCGDTSYGAWTSVLPFTTDCGAITSYPWAEGFDTYTETTSSIAPSTYPNDDLPLCWRFLNRSDNSSNYPQVSISSNSEYSVSGNCLFFKSSKSTPLYAVLPTFSENIANLQLTFTYRNEGTSVTNGTLIVGYMTDPLDAATFTEVKTCERTTTLTEVELLFPSDAPTGSYIAFKYQGGTGNNFYLGIDDVSVNIPSTCPKPKGLTVSDVTPHTAILNWTETGGATTWLVEYADNADFTQAAQQEVTGQPTVTLSGLKGETTYYARVYAACSADDHSNYSKPVNFTTLVACTVPTEVTISDVTNHTAVVSWQSDNNHFNLKLGDEIRASVSNPYTLTNLAPNTQYTVQIQSVCGGEDGESQWTAPQNFTTLVANPIPTDVAVEPAPKSATISWKGYSDSYNVRYRLTNHLESTIFTEGFENGIDVWTLRDCNNNGATKVTGDVNHSGNHAFTFDRNRTQSQYFISPELTGVSSGMILEFYYCDDHYPNNKVTFRVGYSSTTNETSAFTFRSPVTTTDSQWHLYSEAIPAGTKYICWDVMSIELWYLRIDDIAVGTEASWATATTAMPSVTLTGLTPATTYEYQVQSGVEGEEKSDWTPLATFTTLEANPTPSEVAVSNITSTSATVSWKGYGDSYNVQVKSQSAQKISEQGFENELNGWTRRDCGSNSNVDTYYKHSGNNGFRFCYLSNLQTMTTPQYLISPELSGVTEGTKLEFWYISTDYKTETFYVGTSATGNATEDFTFGDATSASNQDWRKYSVTIPEGTRYICLKYTSNQANLAIDDIIITCNPVLQNYSTTETSLTLTGLDPGTTYEYQVQSVFEDETSDWTPTATFTTLIPIELMLADNADNGSTISSNNGLEANVTLNGRTLWKDGGWNTLCLPFDMTAEQVGEQLNPTALMELDVVGKYTAENVPDESGTYQTKLADNGTLYLYFKNATEIKAGVPYIIKWESGSDIENPLFSGVTISGTYKDDNNIPTLLDGTAATFTGGKFVGTYGYTEYLEENRSILLLGSSNTLYWPQPDLTSSPAKYPSLGAFRAYFDLGTNEARSYVLTFDDGSEASGINDVHRSVVDGTSDNWYTLDGRKLDKQPSRKGLYIRGGKKVVIKK